MHMKAIQKSLAIMLALLLCSCTSLGNYFKEVPAFDQKSYESFTYLKADVLMFYDTFETGLNVETYREFVVRFNRMKEYESGKTGNEEITGQLEIIKTMFERHCSEVLAKPYSKTMMENKKEIMSEAFNVLIKTEYLKKK